MVSLNTLLQYIVLLLPPVLAVGVTEMVWFVCVSVSTLTAELFDEHYDVTGAKKMVRRTTASAAGGAATL